MFQRSLSSTSSPSVGGRSASLSRRDLDAHSPFTPSVRLGFADSNADGRMVEYGASPLHVSHPSPSNPRVLPYGEELDAHLSVIHAYYQAQVRGWRLRATRIWKFPHRASAG
jgi:hypothetical protein